jgi:hypothetical protein
MEDERPGHRCSGRRVSGRAYRAYRGYRDYRD